MKADYVHKDTLTATDYVELNKNNELLISYNQALLKENQKLKEVFDRAIKLLGNYKHYSIPDEKQNSDNEDLVNNAFDILKEVE